MSSAVMCPEFDSLITLSISDLNFSCLSGLEARQCNRKPIVLAVCKQIEKVI